METLETKLEELEALMKATILPTISTQGQPGRPTGPSIPKPSFKTPKIPSTGAGVAAPSKKDPVKVSAQLKDPDLKMRAKEQMSFSQGGQWSLGKTTTSV